MLSQLFPAIRATLVLAILTGLVFPLVITGISQAAFPAQANGTLLKDKDGKIVGSALIGQSFSRAEYFHPRPSAAGSGYSAEMSSGTNLGPTSSKLIEGIDDDPATKDADESYAGVQDLVKQYREENGLGAEVKVPIDAVTRSASGLDPHISIANAKLQAPRVAKARKLSETDVISAVDKATEGRDLGVLGEPRVNVLLLNRALDEAHGAAAPLPTESK